MNVVVRNRSRLQAVVEKLLPWFDPAVEAERDDHTEAIRQDSIRARIDSEKVRKAYRQAASKVDR